MPFEAICNLLKERFGTSFATSEFRDNHRVHVPSEHVFEVLKCLKEQAGFDQLANLAGGMLRWRAEGHVKIGRAHV